MTGVVGQDDESCLLGVEFVGLEAVVGAEVADYLVWVAVLRVYG
jgi:hypothetical protein